MERYGRRKVLYFPSTKRIWVFHLLHHFFYTRPLFIFILFRFRPPISLSLFFFVTKKKKKTLLCLGDEKPVFMVRWEERNKFSCVPYGDKKKTFSLSPSGSSLSAYDRRWRHDGSKWITNIARLSCRAATVHFFTVCLSRRVMCVRLKGNSFEVNKSCSECSTTSSSW